VSVEGWNGQVHPAAELFPMLPESELSELADDIAKHGLKNAVTLTRDGVLLDGRNRVAACTRAGVKPRFGQYEGDDPTAYVVSINLRRRHLSQEERAFLAVRLIGVYEDEGRKAKAAAGGDKRSPAVASLGAELHQAVARDESKRSTAKAAADVSVAPRMVAQAKRIAEQAPDLVPLVQQRQMTMSKAETIVKNRAAGIADSDGDSWFTPTWLFEQLGLTFDVDVCAPRKTDQRTAPAAHYFTEDDDGLATDWSGLVWCNPPYSKPEAWTDKMVAHGNGLLLTHMPNNAAWAVRAQRAADAARLVQSMHFVRPNGQTQRPGYSLMLLAYGQDAVSALKAVDGPMVGPMWVKA
jgi:phage N-6-adenine-methyltransferase